MTQLTITASERPERPQSPGDIGGGALSGIGEGLIAFSEFARKSKLSKDLRNAEVSLIELDTKIIQANEEFLTSKDPNAGEVFAQRISEAHRIATESVDSNGENREEAIARINRSTARAISSARVISSQRETDFTLAVAERLINNISREKVGGGDATELMSQFQKFVSDTPSLNDAAKIRLLEQAEKEFIKAKIAREEGVNALAQSIIQNTVGPETTKDPDKINEAADALLSEINPTTGETFNLAEVAGHLTRSGMNLTPQITKRIRDFFDPASNEPNVELGIQAMFEMGGSQSARDIAFSEGGIAMVAYQAVKSIAPGTPEHQRLLKLLNNGNATTIVEFGDSVANGEMAEEGFKTSVNEDINLVVTPSTRSQIVAQYNLNLIEKFDKGLIQNIGEIDQNIITEAMKRGAKTIESNHVKIPIDFREPLGPLTSVGSFVPVLGDIINSRRLSSGIKSVLIDKRMGIGTAGNPSPLFEKFNKDIDKMDREIDSVTGSFGILDTGGGVPRPDLAVFDGDLAIIPSVDNNNNEIPVVMIWNTKTGESEIVRKDQKDQASKFNTAKEVIAETTDPRDLTANSHLQWKDDYGDRTPFQVDPRINAEIARLARERFVNLNQREPDPTKDRQHMARLFGEIAVEHGWKNPF